MVPESAENTGIRGAQPHLKESPLIGRETSLVDSLLKQEALMDQAKNTRTLVKRFVGFLRLAYPREMREFSAAVHARKRRLSRSARVASFFKSRRTGCNRPTTICNAETTKPPCMCKTPCEYAISESEEPDKYKLFFSNPPLCRPTTTVDPMDFPTIDMCGHSCDCHTETISSDNDKEIYIGSLTSSTKSCGAISGGQESTNPLRHLLKGQQ